MDTTFRDGFQSVYGARVLMNDFLPALEAAKEADMLFIDDLGSEKISDEWGKEKINSLIDVRYNAEKPMIITTNLSAEEMIDFLKFKGINKISDRLNEMLKEFNFTWQTKRKPKSKSFWEE